jgi:hypothetical protein
VWWQALDCGSRGFGVIIHLCTVNKHGEQHMDLKDFVKQALVDITSAVDEANGLISFSHRTGI